MKHVKLKILLSILISNVVLLTTFLCVLTYALPSYFEGDAVRAIEDELNSYRFQEMSGIEDFDVQDFGMPGQAPESYLNSAINYVYPQTDSESAIGAEKEVLDFCSRNSLREGKCYTFTTDHGHYILAEYTDAGETDSEYAQMVLYINIQPFIEFIPSLSIFIVIVCICETGIMCFIGLRLGRGIERADETQRNFFQNSSHELKTPLMSIQGYAEGIQTGLMDAGEASEVIVSESERMARLVDEILYISKIDANMSKPEMEKTDIREVLYECMRSVEPFAVKMKKVTEPVFAGDEISVMCDEEQLIRAFRNILVNGIRHCESSVVISCETAGRECCILFSDDGSGIDENDLPHIFDRFYTGSGGSTGIGLALAREIVQLHRGKIKAYNGEKGAVFEVKLPRI